MDDVTYVSDILTNEGVESDAPAELRERVDIFPTKLLAVKFNDIQDTLLQIQDEPHFEITNSKVRSTDSQINIFEKYPELYKRIKENIDFYIEHIAGWAGNYEVISSWHTKVNPGDSIGQTQFNGYILAGALCTNAIEGDGIVFSKGVSLPDDGWSFRPPVNNNALASESYIIKLPMTTGMMVLFPSYLIHHTPGDLISCNDRGMVYFTVGITSTN
jgi:hypothetical protein